MENVSLDLFAGVWALMCLAASALVTGLLLEPGEAAAPRSDRAAEQAA